jgi:hypothetical protein
MHFPKFWVLARKGGVCAWGWSDVSQAAAQADGDARVGRIFAWLANGGKGPRNGYGYSDRPMREPVLHEFPAPEGRARAVVTRNSYGCLVLNTTDALFVDVDEKPGGLGGLFSGLFGKRKTFEDTMKEHLETWCASHEGWGWRAYRTKAGIRLLAIHAPITPEDPVCQEVFHAFQADRLYQKLCVNQKCFRARLTPKPWRCGVERPRKSWPFADQEAEAEFTRWEEEYRRKAAGFAACRLLGQFGTPTPHAAIAEVVAFHDQATGALSDRPLA